jgi:hypothetical protein
MAIELLGFARAGDRVVVFPAEAAKPKPGAVLPPTH